MEIHYLKAFAALTRHRNVTKAALELHTTQPALSKQLKKLEETYNVILFIRTARGVELTPEGTDFLKCVEPILGYLEKLERKFSKSRGIAIPPPLRLGAGFAFSAIVLPKLVEKFRREHPNVEVILRTNYGGLLDQMLAKGSLDLVVTSSVPGRTDFVCEPCLKMKIVAIVARGYSLPKQKTLQTRDFENLPLIVHSNPNHRGITEMFLRQLRNEGIKPKIPMRCDSPEAIKAAVKRSLGVGILYHAVVKDDIKRGLFKCVQIAHFPAEAESYVVYHKSRPLPKSAGAFLEILRSYCQIPQHKK